jgi:hypothetical protein
MKRLLTLLWILLLGATLTFAKLGAPDPLFKTETGKKSTKTRSHAKKGGKKVTKKGAKKAPADTGTGGQSPK